jgi:hypothetical protein
MTLFLNRYPTLLAAVRAKPTFQFDHEGIPCHKCLLDH